MDATQYVDSTGVKSQIYKKKNAHTGFLQE
jgi:hypothetical protein